MKDNHEFETIRQTSKVFKIEGTDIWVIDRPYPVEINKRAYCQYLLNKVGLVTNITGDRIWFGESVWMAKDFCYFVLGETTDEFLDWLNEKGLKEKVLNYGSSSESFNEDGRV